MKANRHVKPSNAPPSSFAGQRRAAFTTEMNTMNLDVLARMRANLQARQHANKDDVHRSHSAGGDAVKNIRPSSTNEANRTESRKRSQTASSRDVSKLQIGSFTSAPAKRSRKRTKRQSLLRPVSTRSCPPPQENLQYLEQSRRKAYDTTSQYDSSDTYEYSEYTDQEFSPRPQRALTRNTEECQSKYKEKLTSSKGVIPAGGYSTVESIIRKRDNTLDEDLLSTGSYSSCEDGEYRVGDGRKVADFGVQANTGTPEHVLALAELLRYQTQVKQTAPRFSLVPSISNSVSRRESRQGSPQRSAMMELNQTVTDDPLSLQFPGLPVALTEHSPNSSVPIVLAKPEEMKMPSMTSSQAKVLGHKNPVLEDLRGNPELSKIYKIFQQDSYFVNLSFDLLYSTDAWRAGFNHLKEVIYRDIYEERAATLQELQTAQTLIQGYEETTETLNQENQALTEKLRVVSEEAEKILGMHGMLDFDLQKVVAEKTALETQSIGLQDKIKELDKELSSVKAEKLLLEEKIRTLHDELAQKEQRINKSVEKAREFKDQLDTYTREGQVEKMRDMINTLNEQLAERGLQVRDRSDAVEKLEKRVSKLTSINQALVTEREKFIYRLEVSLMTTEDKLGALIRLRERVRRLREDKLRVTTELKETAAKLEKMQEIGKTLKGTLKTREGELKEFKVEYNRMKEEFEAISADFNYKEARINNLEQQLELYKQELSNLRQEMKEKADMFHDVTVNSLDNQQRIVTVAALNDRVQQLESDKSELRQQIAELKEELSSVRKENAAITTEKEHLINQVAIAKEKISYHELLYTDQKKMLEDTENQRIDLHNTYLKTQSTIAELKLNYETSKLRQDSLEAENAKLIKSSEVLSGELDYLRKENENLRLDKGTDGDALRKLQQEFDHLSAKYTNQTQDVEDKQLRIQELIFQNDRMMKFIEEVKDNYRGDNVVNLINENLRLKTDLDNLMAIKGDALGKTASLVSENNEMKETVSKLHIDAATKDAQLGRAYNQNETLNKKLLLLTKENKDIRDKLAFLENKAKSYEYKIETLKLELEKRNRLLAARELEVSKLRAMCVKLTQE